MAHCVSPSTVIFRQHADIGSKRVLGIVPMSPARADAMPQLLAASTEASDGGMPCSYLPTARVRQPHQPSNPLPVLDGLK
jgi:hypothetical protein